jgi:hypothetical protein
MAVAHFRKAILLLLRPFMAGFAEQSNASADFFRSFLNAWRKRPHAGLREHD